MAGTWNQVLRRQPIDADTADFTTDRTQLTRSLGLWQLTAIGLGAIIGAGIFALAGEVAKNQAGPAVSISFIVAGIASAAAAFSYAEFAGLIPRAGSAYTYGYAVLGELPGWVIGWDLLLEYTAIVAVVAIGISGYFTFLVDQIGIDLPAWMLGAPGTGEGHVIDLFAVILCLLIAYLLNQGIKTSARVETVLVFVKILIVLAVIGVGAFFIDGGNFTPFFPFGVDGAIGGAAIVFFAVFGYDAMSTAAEESKDAKNHLPKAIVYSLGIAMVLYLLACLVLTGMVNYRDVDEKSAFATAFADVGLPVIASIISVFAVLSILTVMLTFLLGVTRVWFSMSRDGLLPRWFAKTHERRKVPSRMTWIIGGASAVLAGVLPIGEAAELTNIGILLAFVVVCIAVIVLRYRRPDLPRSFRLPWMPVVPAVGIVFSIWLIALLEPITWLRFLGWFALGLVVYVFYSRHRSRLAQR